MIHSKQYANLCDTSPANLSGDQRRVQAEDIRTRNLIAVEDI